jgi:NCS1 family nucleobase:cation symporter-1
MVSPMTTTIRQRLQSAKSEIKKKTTPSGWIIPKETTTFADPDKWSNIDADVTPVERRT